MGTMNSGNQSEGADAEKVDQALQVLQRGDDRAAESLLLEVVQRAPAA